MESEPTGGTGAGAADPFGGRPPTSHERSAGRPWDASYRDGPAPWDIGHPQPAVVRLASRGAFVGAVLDVGCGTGENALWVAASGLPVLGVDVAETALAMARDKATARAVDAEFALADALDLGRLGRHFDTVVDCGLFHALDHEERRRYAAGLRSVIEPDGTLYVLCFSDQGHDRGPHPVGRSELDAVFGTEARWELASVDAERLETRFHPAGAPAWLATVRPA